MSIPGATAGSMRDSTSLIKNTERASILGQTAECMMETGLMENNTGLENISCLMDSQEKANGLTESEPDGLMKVLTSLRTRSSNSLYKVHRA